MDKKESRLMGSVSFECPLKKLLLEKADLGSGSALLNLKIWILKMRVPQGKLFNFWDLAF